MMGAQVQGHGEASPHDRQPLDQVIGHVGYQEVVLGDPSRGPLASLTQKGAVKDLQLIAHLPKLVVQAGLFNAAARVAALSAEQRFCCSARTAVAAVLVSAHLPGPRPRLRRACQRCPLRMRFAVHTPLATLRRAPGLPRQTVCQPRGKSSPSSSLWRRCPGANPDPGTPFRIKQHLPGVYRAPQGTGSGPTALCQPRLCQPRLSVGHADHFAPFAVACPSPTLDLDGG
jgi:hypothetical protein